MADRDAPASDLPQRIGRYEVLGRLATGGMADILLGRLDGPSGFMRPVVIKRILPHLARQPSFVEMFLDEARIAAGIRHPNVVSVEDLGRDGGDLYLVMEYLEGESAASLLRRARARARPLPVWLAAHIVAEVCAGLHAAHELAGADGASRNVVHRDVSPQNIFITHSGSVKVLDFGIAKAADRATHTEAGALKGKLEYMSPEQCQGLPVDRRSDVFALGAVLYELTTGRRLFRRANEAATLRAILDEPVTPPSGIVADYPAALEAICLRALARLPEDRYPTAAAMRRELLGAVRPPDGAAPSEEELASLLRELFADRIVAQQGMLRTLREGAPVSLGTITPGDEGDEGAREWTPRAASRRRVALGLGTGAAALAVAVAVRSRRRPQPPALEPTAAIAVSDLFAAWSTPNAVRWMWKASGDPDRLRSYELVVGASEDDVLSRRNVEVRTPRRHPELGRFLLPHSREQHPTLATLTDGHAPDTEYFAQLIAVDTSSRRAVSNVASARTTVAPIGEASIFADERPPPLRPACAEFVPDPAGAHAASRAFITYLNRCVKLGERDLATCEEGEAVANNCFANVYLQELAVDLARMTPGGFATAFLELAVSVEGSEPSFWSEFGLQTGDGRWWQQFPFTFPADGSYHVYQLKLSGFKDYDRPGAGEPLSHERLAGKLTGLRVGASMPAGSRVRIDEARVRW